MIAQCPGVCYVYHLIVRNEKCTFSKYVRGFDAKKNLDVFYARSPFHSSTTFSVCFEVLVAIPVVNAVASIFINYYIINNLLRPLEELSH